MAVSHDPTFPLFPIFSFLGFIISLVPLPWHAHAWNAGTCAFMVWTAVLCLINFVGSLVWKGNINNPAPIWCDISTKLLIGGSVGIPASALCISRRLYYITAATQAIVTRRDKRNMVITDLCIAVGIPAIIMGLHIVVQGHRFDIYEDIGCFPVVYNTALAYILIRVWPIVLGVVSLVFSCLTLRTFWLRRLQFHQLISTNSALSVSRYVRLMMLAIVDIMCSVPFGAYIIYIGTKGVPLQPWISWEDTHFNFSRVGFFPALLYRSGSSTLIGTELTRWLPVVCAFLFFGLFGFATEAQKHYRKAFWAVMKPFGFKPAEKGNTAVRPSWAKFTTKSGTSSTGAGVGSLPVYIPATPGHKKGKANSFTSSFISDVELSTYADTDIDNSTAYSPTSISPPKYAEDPVTPSTLTAAEVDSAHQTRKGSIASLRSHNSSKVCVTPQGATSRSPSPAPFSDVSSPPYHRPFTPPSVYPIAQPHTHARAFADAIQVTVQTESTHSQTV